jgi:hypothetical protein
MLRYKQFQSIHLSQRAILPNSAGGHCVTSHKLSALSAWPSKLLHQTSSAFIITITISPNRCYVLRKYNCQSPSTATQRQAPLGKHQLAVVMTTSKKLGSNGRFCAHNLAIARSSIGPSLSIINVKRRAQDQLPMRLRRLAIYRSKYQQTDGYRRHAL